MPKIASLSRLGKVATTFMLKLIRPIVFTFLRSKAIKQLAMDIIRVAVTKTDNDVDDRLADMLEKALFPEKQNPTIFNKNV